MTKAKPQDELIGRHPLAGPLVELRLVIHPLTQQGEDRIWRAAEKACAILDKAEDEKAAMLSLIQSQQAEIERQARVIAEMSDALDEADNIIAINCGTDTPKSWDRAIHRVQEARTLLEDS